MKRAYLAGPDVFREDAIAYGEKLKSICTKYDIEGCFPFDNEIPVSDSPERAASEIFKANIAMIRSCDVGIMNLTPFRGPSADPGTCVELGYFLALERPVFGYSTTPREFFKKSKKYHSKKSDFPQIEDFGLFDNLMVAVPTQLADRFFTHKDPLTAFEKAVEAASWALSRSAGRKKAAFA